MRLLLGSYGKGVQKINRAATETGNREYAKPKERKTDRIRLAHAEWRQEEYDAPFANTHAVETDGDQGQQRDHWHEDRIIARGHIHPQSSTDEPHDKDIGSLHGQ